MILEKKLSPLVSIICTTYNQEKFIRCALDGFLSQKTNFSFEVIIHDDASTDFTPSIIKEYEERNPEIFVCIYRAENWYSQEKNIWKYLFENVAKGKYIAICEGDDFWIDPLKLQKQVDYLENNPKCGICYTRARIYNENIKDFDKTIGGGAYVDYRNLLIWNPIMTVTTLFRKELYFSYQKNVCPENKKWKLGDYPLWLWIAKHSEVHFMNEITSVYRCVNNSASHQVDIKKQELFNRSILEIRLFYLEKYPILDFSKDILFDDFYRRNSVAGILNRDRKYACDNMKLIKHKSLNLFIKLYLSHTKLGFLIVNIILRSKYNYGI